MPIPDRLRRAILADLQEHPQHTEDLLRIVADFQTQYQEDLRRKRKAESASTLTMLASFCDLSQIPDAAWLFDFVQLQYPSDLEHRTVADDRVRDRYLELVRRDLEGHQRWLASVRSGADCNYFVMHVKPKL
ncbi:MAG: hypothetical protein E6Q97_31540 [Desulfurellales bacterium]|nr:MAG: hypothetical protein E6Q97_31540 [Desulfurellales bacterium]